MLIIAFTMIILGLLCFIYASFGSGKNTIQPEKSGQSYKKKQTEVLEDRLFNVKYKESKNPFIEKKVLEERNILERKSVEPTDLPPLTLTEPIEPVLPVLEKTAEPEMKSSSERAGVEIEFQLEGILYQDAGKKIPFELKNIKEKNLGENIFSDFKRIGPGLLCEEGKKFVFKVDNASFYYNAEELDRIVFFDEAVVLIPSNPDLAIPVFFTDEIEEFRRFLKERSKTATV